MKLRTGRMALGWALWLAATSSMAAGAAAFDGLPPWHFQMTPEQVTSFTQYGPYKSFRNGDLETYAGIFDGHPENVQFFFNAGRLRRIGIYLYEGTDIKQAAVTWQRAYQSISRQYGKVQLPYLRSQSSDPPPPEAIGVAAGAEVMTQGKVQMEPVKQPSDKVVFATFFRKDVMGQAYYFVTIYYDPAGS